MSSVYFFGAGVADGHAQMRRELGGKGANLAEMTNLGIPVPPGFTISTDVCLRYLQTGEIANEVREQMRAAMARLEELTGRRFGDPHSPLLLSVRSGAAASMPGMMESILDLGLDDESVAGLAKATGNKVFAYDSYRRLIQMYGDVVAGVPAEKFEQLTAAAMQARGVRREFDLPPDDLVALVKRFKDLYRAETGTGFPCGAWDQLDGAIEAVFRSYNGRRAIDYRRVHDLPEDMGTAVNVMAMVYGNMGQDSGTGVVFTRNPSTGEPGPYGEFLLDAQGEDVVAGIRDPEPIRQLEQEMPAVYGELIVLLQRLERHYGDMQDVEFTIERGKLFILQTRNGKRTARAAVRIAVDLCREGRIRREEALLRVQPEQIERLMHPVLDPDAELEVLTEGLPASPGAAVGTVVFDPDEAVERKAAGESVILVRHETSPDDFHGIVAASGVLTARGGMTSHAAVVARSMGKCCIVGASSIEIEMAAGHFSVGDRRVKHGDTLTLDGTSGRVVLGRVDLSEPEFTEEFATLLQWADEASRIRVRANADTPEDATRAREFGARGIGLCRTEHMFFGGDRIDAVRRMIMASNVERRRAALAELLPMQRGDFAGLFRAMDGLPVTIRLLDPPLHEFLPKEEEDIAHFSATSGVPIEQVRHIIQTLSESNPMLGHRGCRLGLSFPEITEMQSRAVYEAACDVAEEGIDVQAHVMVPLVGHVEELRRQAEVVRSTAQAVFAERGRELPVKVGTMIELPRAALRAETIAQEADFFSFGTNDLTQMTWGLSRDDAGSFLPAYLESGILRADPFQTIDQDGVGRLVEFAVEKGRETRPGLEMGVCGEHGGDPQSVAFFHRTGLDYVSCSPFRVPVARLAAAHVALEDK